MLWWSDLKPEAMRSAGSRIVMSTHGGGGSKERTLV